MDVDWCLTCEKRVEAPNLYCSSDCRYLAASSSTFSDHLYPDEDDDEIIIFHPVDAVTPLLDTTSRWTGNDSAGILAWAAEIPYGPPADDSFSSFTLQSVYQPPQLLPPHHQIVPPSLCTNTPKRANPPPSSPLLVTPKPRHISPDATIQPFDDPTTSRVSLKSALTDSSLATPASSHPTPLNLCGIYSHVRSWVIPSPSLVPLKRAASPQQLKPSKLTVSARNTRLHAVKVVSPPDTPHGFPDEGAVQWKANAIFLEQQQHIKPVPKQQLRGYRLPHEFPRQTDDDPSFRARGRKASRAVD
ncbi:hypothetical protein BYT27DRAFT_7262078 [Phlegmacium glaucopus]|nr:hypothetical protein BYT27DRAFT_7262078 [Phlegmacium glaucopus]